MGRESEYHIGNVGGEDVCITVTPTITLTAYEANDAVGTELTFANAARFAGYGGIIKNVLFIDDVGKMKSSSCGYSILRSQTAPTRQHGAQPRQNFIPSFV